jgi:hypothetical protein
MVKDDDEGVRKMRPARTSMKRQSAGDGVEAADGEAALGDGDVVPAKKRRAGRIDPAEKEARMKAQFEAKLLRERQKDEERAAKAAERAAERKAKILKASKAAAAADNAVKENKVVNPLAKSKAMQSSSLRPGIPQVSTA